MASDDLKHIYDISLFNISDLDVLLHEILKYTRGLLKAEAGTIYIKQKNYLKFHVFQNDALSYENIYKFYHSTHEFKLPLDEKNKYLAVDSFLSKKIIMIDDIYAAPEYEFLGAKEDDKYSTFTFNDKEIISMISAFISLSISKAQDDIVKLQELNAKLEKSNENLERKIEERIIENQNKSAIIFHQSKMASIG